MNQKSCTVTVPGNSPQGLCLTLKFMSAPGAQEGLLLGKWSVGPSGCGPPRKPDSLFQDSQHPQYPLQPGQMHHAHLRSKPRPPCLRAMRAVPSASALVSRSYGLAVHPARHLGSHFVLMLHLLCLCWTEQGLSFLSLSLFFFFNISGPFCAYERCILFFTQHERLCLSFKTFSVVTVITGRSSSEQNRTDPCSPLSMF